MATPPRPRSKTERPLDAPLLIFDLADMLRRVKAEDAWKQTGHNAITLLKSGDMRIVLAALRQGADIPSHQTASAISVQIVEGTLRCSTPGETVVLGSGLLLALHGRVPHQLHAVEGAAFLLTLAGSGPASTEER